MLVDHPEFSAERLASLEVLTYGASPMPAALIDRMQELYPTLDISQGYGMTESSAVLTFLDADDHRTGGPRLRSAGRPVSGVVLSIRDDHDNELARGRTGELVVVVVPDRQHHARDRPAGRPQTGTTGPVVVGVEEGEHRGRLGHAVALRDVEGRVELLHPVDE